MNILFVVAAFCNPSFEFMFIGQYTFPRANRRILRLIKFTVVTKIGAITARIGYRTLPYTNETLPSSTVLCHDGSDTFTLYDPLRALAVGLFFIEDPDQHGQNMYQHNI